MQISTLLHQVDIGAIQLPKFQRGFEWTRPRIVKFFDSLYRDFPIGNLLLWKTQSGNVPLRGSNALAQMNFDLLLDGQQRVTTLYGVIRGKTPPFYEESHTDFPGFGIHFHLKEQRFAFPSKKALAESDLWINLTELFKGGRKQERHLLRNLEDMAEYADNMDDYGDRLARIADIPNKLVGLDHIEGDERSLDEIVEIFNAVNSGGQRLSKGDLALARLSLQWPDARETLLRYSREWRTQNLDLSLDWLLLAYNVFLTEEADFDKITKLPAQELKEGARSTKRYIDDVLNLLADRLGIVNKDVLFGPRAIYSMALCWKKMGKAMTYEEQGKLLYWYVHAGMRRANAGPKPTLIGDLRAIEKSPNPIDGLLDKLTTDFGRLDIQPEQIVAGRTSLYYSFLYLMTRLEESQDWRTGFALKHGLLGGQNQLHVHHVFPQSALRKAGVSKELIDQVGNLSFQTAQSNQELGRRLPEEYFPEVETKFPGALESQWIPREEALWSIDRYPDFLQRRRELIAERANELLTTLKNSAAAGAGG